MKLYFILALLVFSSHANAGKLDSSKACAEIFSKINGDRKFVPYVDPLAIYNIKYQLSADGRTVTIYSSTGGPAHEIFAMLPRYSSNSLASPAVRAAYRSISGSSSDINGISWTIAASQNVDAAGYVEYRVELNVSNGRPTFSVINQGSKTLPVSLIIRDDGLNNALWALLSSKRSWKKYVTNVQAYVSFMQKLSRINLHGNNVRINRWLSMSKNNADEVTSSKVELSLLADNSPW